MPCQHGRCDPSPLSSEYRVLNLSLTWDLTGYNFKVLMSFSAVSTLAHTLPSPKRENAYHLFVLLIDYFLLVCDRRFAIDCFPHVRLRQRLPVLTFFRNQVLIDIASIAIWNRNKFVVTLAIAVWGISAAFHIQSKPLPFTLPLEELESHGALTTVVLVNRCRTGE